MRVPRTREEALGAVEVELRKEQSASLGRTGNQLQAALDQLIEIAQQLSLRQGAERAGFVRRHAEMRKEAEKYAWYLIVQREALGLYQHRALEEQYPIPKPIRE